jgi:hypothetical protein
MSTTKEQRSATGKRSKERGKADERDIGRRLGLTRFRADTGDKLDLEGKGLAIQVKGGATVASVIMRQAMAEAEAGATSYKGDLPCIALVDRRSRPLRRWICFDVDAFAAYFGYTPDAGGEG